MTKAEEDAPRIKTAAEYGCPERIWLQHDLEGTGEPYQEPDNDEVTWCWHQVSQYDTEYIRADLHEEAIRAAYAQGREDAAKVCIKWGDDQVVKWDHDDEMREYNKSRAWDALQCAAAIRRGE